MVLFGTFSVGQAFFKQFLSYKPHLIDSKLKHRAKDILNKYQGQKEIRLEEGLDDEARKQKVDLNQANLHQSLQKPKPKEINSISAV